jgi:ligand-binding sensor domain-containing protein
MRPFFFSVIIFFSCLFLQSQSTGQFIDASQDIKIPFTISQFSTKQGLPQSQVIDLIAKKNGALIISTANGIVEYNGSDFKDFIVGNKYKEHIYTKLLWHEKTQQLFGNELAGNCYLLYPKYKYLPKGNCSLIVNDSIFTIGNNGDIYVADVVNLEFKKIKSTGIINASCLILFGNDFFIGNRDSLFKYSYKNNSSKGLIAGDFTELKTNPYDSSIYCVSTKAIYKILNSNISKIFQIENLVSTQICQDVDFIDNKEFFVATSGGLYQVAPDYVDYYSKKSALPSSFLQSLFYNKDENCLFVGTGEKGLLKLQLKNCYSFSSREGFGEASSLSSIIKTKKGEVLIGETLGRLFKLGIDTVYTKENIYASFASLAEIDEAVFAGTWGEGVKVIKDNQIISTLTSPANLPNNFVHAAYKDKTGRIWIGTSNGIAQGVSLQSITPFLTNKIKREIICFYELQNGNICIGGSDGVFIVNNENQIIKHINSQSGLEGKEVRCFYEDKEGKLWIGTYNGGLYCYFKNKLIHINKLKNAMLDRDVFCLAKDDYGYFYMTSNHGLWRLKESDLNDFYYGKLNYLVPFHYMEEVGILNTEFNGGFQNNYLKTKLSHFYFPSIQGVVIVTPEEPKFRKLNTTINQILVNDTVFSGTNPEFNRSTYSIQFDFSCPNFLSKYNVYYQYRLENDKLSKWGSLQKNNTVNFKLLPPGTYTFSVRAIDAFNDKEPQIASFTFSIKPLYYETLWFKTLMVLLFLGLTLFIGRLRVQSYRKKSEEKEKNRREIAELELKAIQSQMNPHFVFNSLNSIKYFLSNNDTEKADKYIDHFSFLIRSFLDYSSISFIEIGEEIKMLTSYLELEKMRLNNKFNYNIISNPVYKNNLIPTFLLQPFVENAVKHGFASSDKNHLLFIIFQFEIDKIICTIDDDGVGIDKSLALKSLNTKRSSKGITLAKEKMAILKETHGIHVEIELIDKSTISSKGTLVKITIT